MKISKAHKKFADRLDNPRALEHPEEFLGPNWKNVLNFWFYLDTLSYEQWEIVQERYCELDNAVRIAARDAARAAAVWSAVWSADSRVAWLAAWAAVWDAAWWASLELMGSDKILSQNKSLTFFPMFIDVTP